MQTISDEKLGKLLSVISHYALENMEDIIPYEKKSEKERETIVKASLKSLEVSSILTLKFLDNDTFKNSKLDQVHQALKDKKFDQANDIINEKESE